MNKLIIKILIGVLVVVGVVGGYYVWSAQKNKSNKDVGFITYKDPKLTDQEKQVFLDRVNSDLTKLAEKDLNKEDTFKYKLDLGAQYFALGELAKSRDAFLGASEVLPENPTPWAELYRVEYVMEDYQSAEEHLQKAIKINPSSAFYWRWLLELERGPLHLPSDRVKQGYEEALRVTNSNVDVVTHYASYLKDLGDLQGAVQQWKKAIEVNPAGKATYEQEITAIQNLVK